MTYYTHVPKWNVAVPTPVRYLPLSRPPPEFPLIGASPPPGQIVEAIRRRAGAVLEVPVRAATVDAVMGTAGGCPRLQARAM